MRLRPSLTQARHDAANAGSSIYEANFRLSTLVVSAGNRVICGFFDIGAQSLETVPQGLKPGSFYAVYGTTEVVPFQNINDHLSGGHH
jgi:hypothetical protein